MKKTNPRYMSRQSCRGSLSDLCGAEEKGATSLQNLTELYAHHDFFLEGPTAAPDYHHTNKEKKEVRNAITHASFLPNIPPVHVPDCACNEAELCNTQSFFPSTVNETTLAAAAAVAPPLAPPFPLSLSTPLSGRSPSPDWATHTPPAAPTSQIGSPTLSSLPFPLPPVP